MSSNLHGDTSPNVGELVTGIVHDAQQLFSQQLTLFKTELREDFSKTREAMVSLAVASGLLLLGCILLSLMLVYLLDRLVPTLPLWGCFGIVGGAFAVIGGLLAAQGIQKLRSFNPLPDKTAKGLEENLEWKTKPTSSVTR